MNHNNLPVCNFMCYMKPKTFSDDLIEKYGDSEKIIVILLADPFNDEAGQYFGNRFEYFDTRTGDSIDFFCPGYLNKSKKGFSQKEFANFINDFEKLTSWKYDGGTNILIMPYKKHKLCFETVYDLNLTKMLNDGLIDDYRSFIESLIRGIGNPDEFIDSETFKMQGGSLLSNFIELCPCLIRKIIKQICDSYKISQHLKLHDIRKASISR